VGYGLGVDIGTASISVAVRQDGKTRTFGLADDRITPAGPQDTGPTFAVRTLAATLRSVLESVSDELGDLPDTVVLAHQARAGRYGQDLMNEAARLAGLDGFTLVRDIQAAATHYAIRERLVPGDQFVVYDLGASAFSVVVAGVTESGVTTVGPTESVNGVGGDDFDTLILADVDRQLAGAVSGLNLAEPVGVRALERLSRESERAKVALSGQDSVVMNVLLPDAPSRSVSRVSQSEVQLTRDAFEAMIVTPLELTLEATHRALSSANVTPDQLAGVLLIGGSAQIPLVSDMLSTSLGVPVHVDPEAVACVALGAAQISGSVAPVVVSGRAGLLGEIPFGETPFGASPEHLLPARRGSADSGQGLMRHRRTMAAVAAALLLFGGVGYVALSPDSPVTQTAGPVDPTQDESQTGQLPSPQFTADPTTPNGSAGTSKRDNADRTVPTASTGSAQDRSGASPSGSGGPGDATGTPPVATSGSIPTSSSSSSPTATPTSTDPGLIIRVGRNCYDLGGTPNDRGQFPVVPCP